MAMRPTYTLCGIVGCVASPAETTQYLEKCLHCLVWQSLTPMPADIIIRFSVYIFEEPAFRAC